MLLGIDIGTSSVKAILYDPDSVGVVALGQQEYPIHKPTPDRAEQDPEDWWNATVKCVRYALDRAGRHDVIGISLCGQMHGGVLLDQHRQPLQHAIIWPDQRSSAEVDELITMIGAQKYAQIAGTLPATGFMAATLLWLKHHDPDLLAQVAQIVFPKDYVRLKLVNSIATDMSDAAASGLFDISAKTWSKEIIERAGLPGSIFPPVLDSQALAGELTPAAAAALGLVEGIPVIVGSADQPATAIGSGIAEPGKALVAIGSGGQVVTPLRPVAGDATTLATDPRLHVFNHAIPDMWYILGAILSAGLSLRWLRRVVGMEALGNAAYERFSAEAQSVTPGAEGLIFLPYLSGERTPHMDPLARGAFVGLSYYHEQKHLARAVMEGVAFALRDTLELSLSLGGQVETIIAAGSGTDSAVWRQILADVLGLPLQKSLFKEQAGLGAAVTAGVGIGIYSTFDEAALTLAQYGQITEPQPEHQAKYNALYAEYQALYPHLREDFHTLSRLGKE